MVVVNDGNEDEDEEDDDDDEDDDDEEEDDEKDMGVVSVEVEVDTFGVGDLDFDLVLSDRDNNLPKDCANEFWLFFCFNWFWDDDFCWSFTPFGIECEEGGDVEGDVKDDDDEDGWEFLGSKVK